MAALTQFCDIFGAINEGAFNNLVNDLKNQRPSLFNYGTISFVKNPKLLCNNSFLQQLDPDVTLFQNPVVTQQPLLGILGYTGPFGFEYCLQFTELQIDFQPSNTIQLPAGLNPPLKSQQFALHAQACAGLDCPTARTLSQVEVSDPAFFPVVNSGDLTQVNHPASGDTTNIDTKGILVVSSPTIPFPFEPKTMQCFCLDVFAVLHVEEGGPTNNPFISLIIDGIEIPEIRPLGLEHSIECYVKTTLALGILPKLKLALNALVFNIANILTIGPTAVSANVPFNPSIEKDQIEVFLTLN
ncbi:MAG TPA: hypothetical protein VGN20_27670 [Mucilaginibacter sp.]|jgi:hypothetical protein